MKITVNGREMEIADGTDLKLLIHSGKVDPDRVILVLNDSVVKNDLWTRTILAEGDRVELVSFVGGG
ncbi:MAG TPA: sulfur carrier protein ThiS [Syntrophorhabdaceae bacterium]|nr:sulfur carrier protein ThiS [Syntrophorhabdaceae bacterium]